MNFSFCGMDCDACEAFIATETDNEELREAVAKEWSEMYGTSLMSSDIECTGCKSSGIKFAYCDQNCGIRKCCAARKFNNCADCEEYPCEQLIEIFKHAPEAKKRLDSISGK